MGTGLASERRVAHRRLDRDQLVLSHYVIDGIGGAIAVTEAILGLQT